LRRVLHPFCSGVTNKSLYLYFALAFGFSWLIWSVGVLATSGILTIPLPNMVIVIIGAHGPLVASLSLTYKNTGWSGVKSLLRSGFNLRMKPIIWIVILLLPVILSGLAVRVYMLQSDFEFDNTLISQPIMIIPTLIWLFFISGSFQEEFGWRGYALPRMLGKWNPIIASIILGALWGIWHLPLFYISGTSQIFFPFIPFLVLTTSFSLLFTWFYLKTNHNLFSALLFHTALNTSLGLFPPFEPKIGGNQMAFIYLTVAYLIVALFFILKDRALWFKLS
jgi:uncharacterized protein